MAHTPHNPLLIEMPDRFETERLTIRCPQRGDGDAVFAAITDSLAELRAFPASMDTRVYAIAGAVRRRVRKAPA